jgi:uncharacterized protein (AIM24 family)
MENMTSSLGMFGTNWQLVTIDEGIEFVATNNVSSNNGGSDKISNNTSGINAQGDNFHSLQVIIHPQRYLNIDQNSLCWTSEGIEVVSESPFARFVSRDRISGQVYDRMMVKNTGTTPACVTIAQNEGHNILSVKVASKVVGLMCFKDSFLCSSSLVVVEDKGFPLLSSIARFLFVVPNELYRCSMDKQLNSTTTAAPSEATTTSAPAGLASAIESAGYVFLQARSPIMSKRLLSNESFQLKSDCLVAYQESCKVSFSSLSLTQKFTGSSFLKFEGPGIVYFSTQTTRRSHKVLAAQRDTKPIQIASIFLSVLILVTVALSRFIDFEIEQIEN